jgi:aspartyl-tRNA(Asn)/glutamyl-tRNA(Gln) amidotransferase subunit C
MSLNIDHLAKLARLSLEAGDHEKVEKKIQSILEHFNQLSQVETFKVAPFFHASPEMELREDTPESPVPVEELMRNAPDAFEGCFRIPKVVGEIES